MPTFIAYDHNSLVTSIVVAVDKKRALAYWQGADVNVHTSKCVEDPNDFIPLDESETGVFPILKTTLIAAYHFQNAKLGTNILTVSK